MTRFGSKRAFAFGVLFAVLVNPLSHVTAATDPLENLCATMLVKFLYQGTMTRWTQFLEGYEEVGSEALANGQASKTFREIDPEFGIMTFTVSARVDKGSKRPEGRTLDHLMYLATHAAGRQRQAFTDLADLESLREWVMKKIGDEVSDKVALEEDIPYAAIRKWERDKLEKPWKNRNAIPESALNLLASSYIGSFNDKNKAIHYVVFGGQSPRVEFQNPNGRVVVHFRRTKAGIEPSRIESLWNECGQEATEEVSFEGKPFDEMVSKYREKTRFLIDQKEKERNQDEEAKIRAMKRSHGDYSLNSIETVTSPSGVQIGGNGLINERNTFVLRADIQPKDGELRFEMADFPRPDTFVIHGTTYHVSYMRDGSIFFSEIKGRIGTYDKFQVTDTDGLKIPMIGVTLFGIPEVGAPKNREFKSTKASLP